MRSAPAPRKSSLRVLAVSAVLACALGSTSCITTYLWGGSVQPDSDGDGAAELEPDIRADGWYDFGVKLVLTPFTLLLDLCTFPVQAAVFGWEKTHEDEGNAAVGYGDR